jgi:hypothetical protein
MSELHQRLLKIVQRLPSDFEPYPEFLTSHDSGA